MINLFPPKNSTILHPHSPNRGDHIGTYVSTFEYYQGLRFDEDPFDCIMEKKSRFKLGPKSWDKVDFLELLMKKPHPHLLVPNNIIAVEGHPLIEYYDYYFAPTLSDISVALEDAVADGSVGTTELLGVFAQIADGLS